MATVRPPHLLLSPLPLPLPMPLPLLLLLLWHAQNLQTQTPHLRAALLEKQGLQVRLALAAAQAQRLLLLLTLRGLTLQRRAPRVLTASPRLVETAPPPHPPACRPPPAAPGMGCPAAAPSLQQARSTTLAVCHHPQRKVGLSGTVHVPLPLRQPVPAAGFRLHTYDSAGHLCPIWCSDRLSHGQPVGDSGRPNHRT